MDSRMIGKEWMKKEGRAVGLRIKGTGTGLIL